MKINPHSCQGIFPDRQAGMAIPGFPAQAKAAFRV